MKYFRPYYKFRFAKANIYKLVITFFLILFTSISSFGQTKEIRYYDGKYTQETALKKFYEFLKVYKDDKLQYNGKLEGNTIKANWKNTLLGSGYVVSNVQYTFYSDRIEIYLLLSTYYKDETNVIMLRPKSVDQQIVKLYKFEEDTHIHDVLAFMNIDKNITKETTSSPKTTTQTKSTTSEQTTETRYYNGRYDYTNGLSSKEVVLHKIKSYIDIKSKAGASFLKLEEKPDFLSGTWTVKSAQGNIVLGLDYEIGDKSLTIKLKYLTVGSQAISKKHPKEELRNLYNVAIENFVLELFKYLEIKDNTSPKQTTTTTAVSNPSGQTIEKDYSKDKITASYNENLSLYVRKINDATVYFYQDNSRINQPKHHEIIEDGKNLRLFTTYTKDYYSAFSLNDMSTDKLYPLTHRNGVFYLYINKKNGTFSFNYQGKSLHSAQYELYISKGDYTVVKVKSDNTIYLFKSDLSKAAISNSQAKGVLVHFADKNPVFVEAGKPTEPTKWKIEKENDKYYIINSSENKKHGVTDYEKSINWGIYTIN